MCRLQEKGRRDSRRDKREGKERTHIYKGSFFPRTDRDWNALPDLIMTSAEGAEDGVARFTSVIGRITSKNPDSERLTGMKANKQKHSPSTFTCYKDSRLCPTVCQDQLDVPVTQDTRHLLHPKHDYSMLGRCLVTIMPYW